MQLIRVFFYFLFRCPFSFIFRKRKSFYFAHDTEPSAATSLRKETEILQNGDVIIDLGFMSLRHALGDPHDVPAFLREIEKKIVNTKNAANKHSLVAGRGQSCMMVWQGHF